MWSSILRVLSVLASCVAAALALRLTFLPQSESTVAAPYIIAALLVAALTGRQWLRLRPDWAWLALLIALVLLVPTTTVARAFGRVDMLALVFHVEFGTEGAGLGGLEPDIAVAGFVSAAVFLAVIMFARVSGWRSATWAAAGLILVANPMLRGAAVLAMPVLGGPAQESLAGTLVDPAILPAEEGQPVDVVIIYVEGTDQIFTDTERFGDAIGRLMGLAGPGAIQLTGVGQMIGTGWSLAGMVATQCGVPMLPNGLRSRNNYEEQVRFMAGVTCLGDVLSARGYATHFIVGGDALFGGITHFYASHGVTDQTEIKTIEAMVTPEEFAAAYPGWMVDDHMVLDIARRRHAELAAAEAPMLLIAETMGPHGEDVWMSRRCTESGRSEIGTDLTAAVRCTADLVADFVEDLRSAPDARPTLFVIMSDHINHSPDLQGPEGIMARRNTAILIPPDAGPDAGPLQVITREATTIDVYPTILDLLGLIEPGGTAGLGVSLLGEAPTLVEQFGREGADARIARDAPLAELLWR